MKYRIALIGLLFSLFFLPNKLIGAQSVEQPGTLLTGGDNASSYQAFSQMVSQRDTDGTINLLVMPFLQSPHALEVNQAERERILESANEVRSELDAICSQTIEVGKTCSVQVMPILTRFDAENPVMQDYFNQTPDGIYLSEGDPIIGMQIIGETSTLTALNQAYQDGAVIAGSAPGIFSASFLKFGGTASHLDSIFNFGALSVYETPGRQNLQFGLTDVMAENQIYTENRVDNLLRAVTITGAPGLSLGMDAQTSVWITNNHTLKVASGTEPVLILDADLYHAAQSVRYTGAFQPTGASNILAHWLMPGEHSYNTSSHQISLGSPAERINRSPSPLNLPPGAGQLYLSADLLETPDLIDAIARFVNQAGGQKANLLLLAVGYQDTEIVEDMAWLFEHIVDSPIQIMNISTLEAESILFPPEITGVIISSASSKTISLQNLQTLSSIWKAGTPVWVNQAAVSWIGTSYLDIPETSAPPSTFLIESDQIQTGLNWLPANLQSQVWTENHWPGLYSQAYHQPQNLVIGLPARTGIEINSLAARVWGEDSVLVMDFSSGIFESGSSANTLIDFFAPKEFISFTDADQNASPVSISTPILPTATSTVHITTPTATYTPSPIPTETQRIRPTATIKPTNTPPAIPPPPDPARMNFMVAVTIIMVVIILFGIWLNRQWMKGNHQE